jgi:small-conductance mechanosensitive channel
MTDQLRGNLRATNHRVTGACDAAAQAAMQRAALLAAALLAVITAPAVAQQSDATSTLRWFEQEWAHPPALASTIDSSDVGRLQTPQSSVEHFVLACRDDDFQTAALALNFRLAPDISAADAATAAERLFFVLNQELRIDWDRLPDRRDGVTDGAALGNNGSPLAGEPRRSISLGTIGLDSRDVPVRIERVKPTAVDADPIWLIAAQTVDNIDALYERHGPSWLSRQMPEWAQTRGPNGVRVWQWIALGIAACLAAVVGFALGHIVTPRLVRAAPGTTAQLARELRWPVAVFAAFALLWIVADSWLALPSNVGSILSPILMVATIAAAAWGVMRGTSFLFNEVTRRTVLSDDEQYTAEQRRLLTQMTVARYVLLLVVAAVALAVVLIELGVMHTVGIALLTSAGAAAVILGIAGHAVLGNLIAGLQIALTRPFRIGDVVYIDGDWGRIEGMSYTYVVERTWDDRRLVIPIKYFINNVFDNWSKTDEFLTKPIYLKVDFRADVQRIRDTFHEFLRDDDDWDPDADDPAVLVTECEDETMVVRLTCGAKDSSTVWHLHCRIRERMISWLQSVEDGAWLPRRRLVFAGGMQPAMDGNGSARAGGRQQTRNARPNGRADGRSGDQSETADAGAEADA